MVLSIKVFLSYLRRIVQCLWFWSTGKWIIVYVLSNFIHLPLWLGLISIQLFLWILLHLLFLSRSDRTSLSSRINLALILFLIFFPASSFRVTLLLNTQESLQFIWPIIFLSYNQIILNRFLLLAFILQYYIYYRIILLIIIYFFNFVLVVFLWWIIVQVIPRVYEVVNERLYFSPDYRYCMVKTFLYHFLLHMLIIEERCFLWEVFRH